MEHTQGPAPRRLYGQVSLWQTLKSTATFLPGAARFTLRHTGGTDRARYCYSVWLRHLVRAAANGLGSQWDSVGELGCGDSLGVGAMALLTGSSNQYWAYDAKSYANPETDLRVLDDLVALLSVRSPIPDEREFPLVLPRLASYRFPDGILTTDRLQASLAPGRVADIRRSIERRTESGTVRTTYTGPWAGAHIDPPRVDFLLAQASLEHAEDLSDVYSRLAAWLRGGGVLSATIDYGSHGQTRDWYGHWTLGPAAWRLLKGGRPFLINRMPHSFHLAQLANHGFAVLEDERMTAPGPTRSSLWRGFEWFDERDLSTRMAFVQARSACGDSRRHGDES